MRGEDLRDHRACHRQRGQARAAAPAFVLQPGVAIAVSTTCRCQPKTSDPRSDRARARLSAPGTAARWPTGGVPTAPATAATPCGQIDQVCLDSRRAPRSRSKSSQTSGARRRSRQSWAGVTRSAAKWAAHGRFVPLRHVTRRQARAGSAAAIAGPLRADGLGDLEARRGTAAAASVAAPRRVASRERPSASTRRRAHRAASVDAACDAGWRCRRIRHPQHRRDLEARGSDLSQQRQRQAPLLLKPHRAGIRASCRASGVSHASGRYSAAPSIQARMPVQSATVTATWQLATLPSVPQY